MMGQYSESTLVCGCRTRKTSTAHPVAECPRPYWVRYPAKPEVCGLCDGARGIWGYDTRTGAFFRACPRCVGTGQRVRRRRACRSAPEGCTRYHVGREGYCSLHGARVRRWGDPFADIHPFSHGETTLLSMAGFTLADIAAGVRSGEYTRDDFLAMAEAESVQRAAASARHISITEFLRWVESHEDGLLVRVTYDGPVRTVQLDDGENIGRGATLSEAVAALTFAQDPALAG